MLPCPCFQDSSDVTVSDSFADELGYAMLLVRVTVDCLDLDLAKAAFKNCDDSDAGDVILWNLMESMNQV